MFRRWGALVSRYWVLVLLGWAALVVGIKLAAPRFDDVTHDGDFAYLPKEMTSVQGQKLLHDAFPDVLSKSHLALVVARPDGELRRSDFDVADRLLGQFTPQPGIDSPVIDVRSYQSPVIGKKLVSRPGSQGQAVLAVLLLSSEFMAVDNMKLVAKINRTLDVVLFESGLRLALGEQGLAHANTVRLLEEEAATERVALAHQVCAQQIELLEFSMAVLKWADAAGGREPLGGRPVLKQIHAVLMQLTFGAMRRAVTHCDELEFVDTPEQFQRTIAELTATQQQISDVLQALLQTVGQLLDEMKRSPDGLLPEARARQLSVWEPDRLTLNADELSAATVNVAHLPPQPVFPAGLRLGMTGSAAVGADMLDSARESIRNTGRTTILLVVLILLLVYRAPGLVVVPLATIAVSVSVAMDLVALLAQLSSQVDVLDFKIFKTTKVFILVILYGAGTDYCLFLIARYREELRRGTAAPRAIATALGRVGDALVASALTTIVGLAMMFFADFGKFRNSGPAIALCLVVALGASVTLAPALLRASGRAVFWPFGLGLSVTSRESLPRPLGGLWHRLAGAVSARPGLILLLSLLLLAPLAGLGFRVPVTYDLLGELEAERPSVRGTQLFRRHFRTSEIDPVTMLAHHPDGRFLQPQGEQRIARLTKELFQHQYVDSAGQRVRAITSVRSLSEPLGNPPGSFNPFSSVVRDKWKVLRHPKTKALYRSEAPGYAGNVARFDLVFRYDPFSMQSVRLLDDVETWLTDLAARPDSDWHDARFVFTGTTAGIRDLRSVTQSDQRRIQVLVVLAVLAVLLLILRRPVVCVYLILSVLLGYFVTIGITQWFFAWQYGATFHGLDWKVPIFLFVLLIALGADYNIYLTTRVFEEQKRLGPIEGLRTALVRTGGIITSCGLIMAGTFASMSTGTLRAMHELGFALSLGVLLDTFVIRTILVPAFLALLARRTARKM